MTTIVLKALAGCMVIGCAVLLYFIDPATSRGYPTCPLHALTGLYCPGCGSLRATHQLLHGNLTAGLRFNPLMVISLPVLGILVTVRRLAYRPLMAWSAMTILLAYGILRNIPVWPLILLAPHSN
jgi:hypothetical protein